MFAAHVEETVEAAHSNGPEGHKCRVMHGHSWRIEATWNYAREALNEYGWGPDFGEVKAIIRRLDHQDLNALLTFPPSAENIAVYLHNEISKAFPGAMLSLWIKVHEGRGNTINYWGE